MPPPVPPRAPSLPSLRTELLRSLGVLAVNFVTGSERLTRIAAGAAELFTLRYSRKQEYESDDLAIGSPDLHACMA